MPNRAHTFIKGSALLASGAVMAATIAQMLRQDSWAPLWTIGWLPAVLLVGFAGPRGRVACMPRLRRRSQV